MKLKRILLRYQISIFFVSTSALWNHCTIHTFTNETVAQTTKQFLLRRLEIAKMSSAQLFLTVFLLSGAIKNSAADEKPGKFIQFLLFTKIIKMVSTEFHCLFSQCGYEPTILDSVMQL